MPASLHKAGALVPLPLFAVVPCNKATKPISPAYSFGLPSVHMCWQQRGWHCQLHHCLCRNSALFSE